VQMEVFTPEAPQQHRKPGQGRGAGSVSSLLCGIRNHLLVLISDLEPQNHIFLGEIYCAPNSWSSFSGAEHFLALSFGNT
jgi:hypothetical protein